MKKNTLPFFLICLLAHVGNAQVIQLGTALVNDQGNRLITTSDGGYITAGSAGPNAVLYKTDCLGNLVAKIEKSLIPGPAVFWDAVELPDGSIVAVGSATVATPTDTLGNVFLLKTTPMLVEVAASNFLILGKDAVGKSIAKTPTGHLLVWGEVTGVSIDFTDAFFQRVSPTTLLPTANPVIFNNGVDLASRIIATADGNYVLSGNSFFGNIFNPDAPIDNILRAYKVDENGTLVWEATVRDTFLAKYGVATVCGVAQSSVTGNIVLGGTLFGGTDQKKQDAFFALISNEGAVLDTAYIDAPEQQRMYAIGASSDFLGVFTVLGEGAGSPLGIPTFAAGQVYELVDDLIAFPASIDLQNPAAFRDFAEIDPGRYAFMALFPDNPFVPTSTDIVLVTPTVVVDIAYQNCALAVSSGTPGVAFQWIYEGQPIPDANQGVYFPGQPGLYQVQVLDYKGCYGISDTFRVEGPTADFDFDINGLSVQFTNTSVGANEYYWNFGGGSSTETNPSFTYPNSGVYFVSLIAQNNCGILDTTIQQIGVTPTGEPSWLGQFSLSPNPTKGIFQVEMSGEPQENVSFSLSNAVGQMVEQVSRDFRGGILQQTFDLKNLPAGIYLLQIRSGNDSKNVRVVKE